MSIINGIDTAAATPPDVVLYTATRAGVRSGRGIIAIRPLHWSGLNGTGREWVWAKHESGRGAEHVYNLHDVFRTRAEAVKHGEELVAREWELEQRRLNAIKGRLQGAIKAMREQLAQPDGRA